MLMDFQNIFTDALCKQLAKVGYCIYHNPLTALLHYLVKLYKCKKKTKN